MGKPLKIVIVLSLLGGMLSPALASAPAPALAPALVPALVQDGADEGAKIISSKSEATAITIYNDNLAMVSELREVTLPAGQSTIVFEGVSDLIIPQTALLQEFSGFTIEQNFDFNLLTKDSLLQSAVGEKITLVTTNPATGQPFKREGHIVSGGKGVMIDFGDRYEALQCSALPERIIFDALPEGYLAKPTLSINVRADRAGPQKIRLAYLTSGLEWEANYRFDLGSKEQAQDPKGRLSAWLTVKNHTSLSLEQAEMAAVAGDLQRLWQTRARKPVAKRFYAACWQRGSSKIGTPMTVYQFTSEPSKRRQLFMPSPGMMMSPSPEMEEIVVTSSRFSAEPERENLGDYKLYRVPRPTDLAGYQTKQISFLDKSDIEYEKIHVLHVDGLWADSEENETDIEYRINNDKEGSLGQPLPMGTWRVMQALEKEGESRKSRPQSPFYLGEDYQENLAVDLPVKINVGYAADVTVDTQVTNEKERKTRKDTVITQRSFTHEIKNASPRSVMVEIIESEEAATPPRLISSSQPPISGKPRPTWRLVVAPNSTKTLKYTASWEE